MLDNIIDNAVKYSDAGTEIALSVRKTGTEMLFTVTDHGIGYLEKRPAAGIRTDVSFAAGTKIRSSGRRPGIIHLQGID